MVTEREVNMMRVTDSHLLVSRIVRASPSIQGKAIKIGEVIADLNRSTHCTRLFNMTEDIVSWCQNVIIIIVINRYMRSGMVIGETLSKSI